MGLPRCGSRCPGLEPAGAHWCTCRTLTVFKRQHALKVRLWPFRPMGLPRGHRPPQSPFKNISHLGLLKCSLCCTLASTHRHTVRSNVLRQTRDNQLLNITQKHTVVSLSHHDTESAPTTINFQGCCTLMAIHPCHAHQPCMSNNHQSSHNRKKIVPMPDSQPACLPSLLMASLAASVVACCCHCSCCTGNYQYQ